MRGPAWLAVVLLLAMDGALVQAQASSTATVRGVVADATGRPVGAVDVWITGPDLHATTDSTGAFTFLNVPAGPQLIQLRRVGYSAHRDTLTAVPGSSAIRKLTLELMVATLDTVHTRAGAQKYLSPTLQRFEERRLSGQGGYFVSDSVFRQNENSTLLNVLASRLPGVMRNQEHALVSTRKNCRGPVLLPSPNCKGKQIPDCYVSIYIDGTLLYRAQMRDNTAPPDLSRYETTQFAGAEFYAGGASASTGMHSDDDGCGSLWLWTRER